MNCRTTHRRLVPFLDDELAPGEAEEVRAHLARCPDCANRRARLERSCPRPPQVAMTDGDLRAAHLRILHALDGEPLPSGPTRASAIRRALAAEVRLPRGLIILYAAALLGAIIWGAGGAIATSPARDVAAQDTEDPVRASLELHQPAAYTPSDGWF